MTDLTGRVILVSGAGRGIGRAICLAAVQAGAFVCGGSRTTSDLDEVAAAAVGGPGTFTGVRLDVTELGSIEKFAETAIERHGRIDGLVNNTGAGVTVPSLSISGEQFDSAFAFNTKSMFFCSQRCVRAMQDQGRGGSIVSISSEPSEIAALTVFLLSDACAAMTGQVITVDGGQSVPLAALGMRSSDRGTNARPVLPDASSLRS